MTLEIDIRAVVFGGLMVTCRCDREGVQDAMFASSGNRLPESMFRKLVNSWKDMNQVHEEIWFAKKLGEI